MNTRRSLLRAGIGAAAAALLPGQQPDNVVVPGVLPPVQPVKDRSTVVLLGGSDRRRLVRDSLAALDPQLRTTISRKTYVLIKPNLTSVTNQVASTHPDALRGILDYLAPWFRGPVVIAEAASGDTREGFDNFSYHKLIPEFRPRQVSLIDLNEEGRSVVVPLIDRDIHLNPVRMAARFFDSSAFVLCAAVLKTHDSVVATLAVKNMAMGAPLHSVRGASDRFDDKRKFHNGGPHQQNYNLMAMAQKLAPNWGLALIDGFEGMEGNGPVSGTPVPSRLMIASMDYVAADRVGVELMGMPAEWVGYLRYCEQVGVGNYDLGRIDVRGEKIETLKRKYRLHRDVDRQLRWLGPLA